MLLKKRIMILQKNFKKLIISKGLYKILGVIVMYKVLIVDDDKVSRYILKRYNNWDKFGFSIAAEACDGKEAITKLSADKFDMVITDIRMPGMNGLEFLGEVKSVNYDVCVILMSTYSEFEYAKQGIRLGAFDYIIKPVNDKMLDEALTRAQLYLSKKVIEEDKKNVEKKLMVYYPESCVSKLFTLITEGNSEAIIQAEKLFLQITDITDDNILKTEMAFNNLSLKLQEEIFKIWPWLKKLQGTIVDKENIQAKSIVEIKTSFIQKIKLMVEMVQRFELHQTDSLVKITCEYIMQHVEEEVSLEKVAEEVNANKDYVGKLFKQTTGYNFKQYVTKVKMEHAKYLIKMNYYKNYEICEKLGYSNADYFSKLFKNYTGYTPMEFRKII